MGSDIKAWPPPERCRRSQVISCQSEDQCDEASESITPSFQPSGNHQKRKLFPLLIESPANLSQFLIQVYVNWSNIKVDQSLEVELAPAQILF
jgi:hypothetical protein